eukprot:COSAG06_NODE_28155_length_579_cov_1.712500_1_plen_94_part_01
MIATRLALLQMTTTVLRHVCIYWRPEPVLAKSSAFSQTLYKMLGTQRDHVDIIAFVSFHCVSVCQHVFETVNTCSKRTAPFRTNRFLRKTPFPL